MSPYTADPPIIHHWTEQFLSPTESGKR